jgi:uncharacterized protein
MKDRLSNKKEILSRYIINDIYPEEHIISLGRKCNSNCIYCINNAGKDSTEMLDLKTGKKIIDFIFTIPKDYYYIEFTGGEPFENFDVLFKLTDYAKNKAFLLNKDIHFSVVSNLIDLKPEYIKFIIRNNITICTSLDGPKHLHNKTRKSPYYKDTYSNTLKNLKKIIYYSKKGVIETPNIITTVTKHSLAYPKEIVDEYIKLNISRIQLGFLEPLGRAENLWKSIGYTYKDYLDFYFKAIDYIIYLNIKKEIPVYEKGLLLLLRSVLTQNNSRHRAIDIANRLAYDFKGNIYPSDEARIIGEEKDFTFKILNVENNNFNSFIHNKKTILFLISNFQELINPLCSKCPYSFYCKITTHYSYICSGRIFGNMIDSERCQLFNKIFEFIFKKLEDKEIRKLFNIWIELYP